MLRNLLTRRRLVCLTAAVMAAGILAATQAQAHAHLKSSVPAANATVTAAPTSLILTFGESIEPKFSGATITGPDMKAVKTGPATGDPKDPASLIVPITETLAAGKYTVDWRNLSVDGHKLKGSFTFTVKL